MAKRMNSKKVEFLMEQLKATELSLNALKASSARLRAELEAEMERAEVDKVEADGLTVTRYLNPAAKVLDWAEMQEFILKHEALDLLQRRVSVAAARERLEAGEDLPVEIEMKPALRLKVGAE